MAFTPHDGSVRLARGQVRRALGAWGIPDDIVDALVLVTSELVTNGIRVCPRTNVVQVQLTVSVDSVLLEVSDPSSVQPQEKAATPEDEGGRGLLLAREYAQELGVKPRPHVGKTVYARFVLSASA
jgi:anti-sigma regulatory factor (Ser/Thr protein kinase)